MTFSGLTVASGKMAVVWNVEPSSVVKISRRFRGANYLNHQGANSSEYSNLKKVQLKLLPNILVPAQVMKSYSLEHVYNVSVKPLFIFEVQKIFTPQIISSNITFHIVLCVRYMLIWYLRKILWINDRFELSREYTFMYIKEYGL